jgi:hypothetical protein
MGYFNQWANIDRFLISFLGTFCFDKYVHGKWESNQMQQNLQRQK